MTEAIRGVLLGVLIIVNIGFAWVLRRYGGRQWMINAGISILLIFCMLDLLWR